MINVGEGITSYLPPPRLSYRVLVRNVFLGLIRTLLEEFQAMVAPLLCCRFVDE